MTTAGARNYSEMFDNLGLCVPEHELNAIDIAALLDLGSSIKSSSSWLIGDCVEYAQRTQNDDWINHLGFRVSKRTLWNYRSVASKFPRHRRRAELSFRHHDAVKALSEEEQDHWLSEAVNKQYTSDELRQVVKDVQKVEKRTVIGHVGSIDKLLSLDLGLPLNFEVKIVYTVVLESEAKAAA